MLSDITALAESLATTRNSVVERELIRIVEVLEGRVPTNAEIQEHGLRRCHANGYIEWLWRGNVVLAEHPVRFEDGKVTLDITAMTP